VGQPGSSFPCLPRQFGIPRLRISQRNMKNWRRWEGIRWNFFPPFLSKKKAPLAWRAAIFAPEVKCRWKTRRKRRGKFGQICPFFSVQLSPVGRIIVSIDRLYPKAEKRAKCVTSCDQLSVKKVWRRWLTSPCWRRISRASVHALLHPAGNVNNPIKVFFSSQMSQLRWKGKLSRHAKEKKRLKSPFISSFYEGGPFLPWLFVPFCPRKNLEMTPRGGEERRSSSC